MTAETIRLLIEHEQQLRQSKPLLVKYRHLTIGPETSRTIEDPDGIYYLLDVSEGIDLESESGIYDLDQSIEQTESHSSTVTISNNSLNKGSVKLIYVVWA